MKNKPMKREITKVFKKYGIKPKRIKGKFLPDYFMMFESYVSLVGIDVKSEFRNAIYDAKNPKYIAYTKLNRIFLDYEDEVRLHEVKGNVDEIQMRAEALYPSYSEKLRAAYKDVLKEDLKHGLVRVAYDIERYDEEATIQSNYGNWDINYSPKLLYLQACNEEYVENLSSHFTNSYLRFTPLYVMSIYFKREMKEEEALRVHQMMADIIDIINRYRVEEYKEKKDDEEYQRRDDFDPGDF